MGDLLESPRVAFPFLNIFLRHVTRMTRDRDLYDLIFLFLTFTSFLIFDVCDMF